MAESVPGWSASLADRYRFERELGRPVALKVLYPEPAAALGPERFQREIRLAARLQHPHILTVLDSGESAGTREAGPYYLSRGWLRIDPTFDPLRKIPRFQQLVAGTA